MVSKLYNKVGIILKKENELFLSIFWGTFAGVFSQGVNFLINVLLARLLSNSYGELVLYNSTNLMFQSISLIGLNTVGSVIISKSLHDNDRNTGKLIPNFYYLVLILSFLLIFYFYLDYIFNFGILNATKFHGSTGNILLFIWFFLSSIDVLQISILTGFREFKVVAKVTLIKTIISIVFTYLLTVKFGLFGTINGYLLSSFFSLFFNFFYIRKTVTQHELILNFHFDVKILKYILIYSLPIFFASLLISPVQWWINLQLFKLPNGKDELYVFGIISQIAMLIQFFPMQISKVILPYMTKQHVLADKESFRKSQNIGLTISLTVALFLMLFSFAFENQIYSIYKLKLDVSHLPYRIMILSSFFAIVNLYLGYGVIAKGKPWIRTIGDLSIAIVLLVVYYLLIHIDQSIVLPISYLISYLVGTLVMIFLSNK